MKEKLTKNDNTILSIRLRKLLSFDCGTVNKLILVTYVRDRVV